MCGPTDDGAAPRCDPNSVDARMLNQSEPACLVIADITGYTSYLAGVELDHAQDILADLIDTVVGGLRPAFKLAKLEGDAAFVYALTDTVDGSSLLDTVERTYFAFRRRLRDIAQASTCECDACIRMPTLDLKVLAHHGPVIRQKVAGRVELVGSSVVVAHRLLKNTITEDTGIRAYAFYTSDCLKIAGIDPALTGLREHSEEIEHLGAVTGWVGDLEAAWRANLERTEIRLAPKATMATFEVDLPGPPSLVWDYLTSPARRPRWQTGVIAVEEATTGGRRGAGTQNHCIHGKDAVVEEILDWRPGEYFTLDLQVPVPGAPKIRNTDVLVGTPDGTHVTMAYGLVRPSDRPAVEHVLPQFEPLLRASAEALRSVLEAEVNRQAAEAEVEPEPALPASAGRFLDPVDSTAAGSSSG
jgi:uncharacterized protein YndB with AHSA1/START domain